MQKTLALLRSFFLLCCLLTQVAYAQLTCGTSISTLTNSQLGDIPSNVSSYTFAAGVYNMPYNVFIAKTSGNGPNLYPYGSVSVWVGKDNNVNLDSVVVEITFTSDVLGVMLDFGAINNNSDGEEQIQRIYPKLSNGQILTNGVTYVYQPGVPTGTVSGTYFVNGSKTIRAYSGNADDGRLTITATTPFRKIRFTQKEITALSVSGPNGVLIKRISYCPAIPDIAVSRNNVNIAMNGTVPYGTTGFGSPVSNIIQISNQGTANLNLSSLSLQNGTHWSIMNNVANVVAPNDTVFLTVDFNPSVSGALTDQLQIVSNDWNEGTYLVNLTGSGLTANLTAQHQNILVPENGTVNAPSTYVGLSILDSIYLQNTGVSNLILSGITLSNGAFSSQNLGNFTLAPGAGTWYVYQFTPTVVGLQTATFSAQSNDPTSPYVIQIQGIGIAPSNVQLTACENQLPLLYHGNTYANSGNYNEIVTGANGQDSLTVLTLSTLLIDSTQSSMVYCSAGTPYNWNGQLLATSGTYQATLIAVNGCDSVATLFFTVQTSLQNTVNAMVCPEDFPYYYAGQQINTPGTYIFHNPTQNGCDSVVNYVVSAYPIPSSAQNLTVCENDFPFFWNGMSIHHMGSYSFTTSSVVTGCDSTAHVNIVTLQTDTVHQNMTLPTSALPYAWGGQQINAAGTYTSVLQNMIGCDSVRYLHLTVTTPTMAQLNVLFEGVQETNPGNHTFQNIVIQSSVTKNITLQNTGFQTLIISGIQLSGGEAILQNANILTIPGGGSATFQVTFQPTTIGAKSNVITIFSNDLNNPQFVIHCNYNAINGPSPDIRCLYNNNFLVNGANLNLPNVNIPFGTPYAFLFEVKNIGQAILNISSITCSNGSVNPNYNNQMVANASQFIATTFNPIASGLQTFNIVVNSNDANEPAFLIPVRVNVMVPALPQPEIQALQAGVNILTQSTLNFNSTSVGQYTSMVLQIKNIGTANLNLTNIQFTNAVFSLVGSLPPVLAPNQSVNLNLRYTPIQVGNASSNLLISNNDANENPFILYLTGTALHPTLPNCTQCNSLSVNSNPKHKAEWVDVMPTFEWQHEEGAGIAYYQVIVTKISGNGASNNPVAINGNLTNTVNHPTTSVNAKLQMSNTLSHNSEYMWFVTAYTSSGLPISCFKRTFKTIPVPNIIPLTCSHPPGVAPFGTKIGAVSNVPIYKNGGCENGIYNKCSTLIPSQSGWSYGWQCVELPSRYYKTKYLINCSGGNGKDYFDVHVQGNRKGFRQLVNNLTTSAPQPDDIITFMRADPNSAGHVALIHKFTPAFSANTQNYTLKIFQENWGSNLSQHLSYDLPLKFINGKWKASSSYPTTRGWVRAKPEVISPGANNAIPTIVTTTPSFTWAKHNNIKGYKVKLYRLVGSCYQIVGSPIQIVGNHFSGQGFPALVPGATYKWTVENIFYNNGATYFAGSSIPSSAVKSVLSDNYYFKVANSAVATNPQGNVNVAGGNLSQIFIQTIASPVNGSEVFYKNDEDWLYLESTHGNGTADILQEFTPMAGDSMRIERTGYLPLQFQVTSRMLNEKMLIPMLEKHPSIVFKVEHLPQIEENTAILKITGKNVTGYKIAMEGDFVTPEFTPWDSIQYLDLHEGMNYFEFMVFNDQDTVLISDKWLNVNPSEEKLNVFYHARNQAAYDVYVDGDLVQSGKSDGVLSLPVSSYNVTFHAFGYAPLRFNIDSDTLLTLAPEKSSTQWFDTLVTNGEARGHYLGGNVSVDLAANTYMHIGKTEAKPDSSYQTWSETLLLSENQSAYTVSWILDYPSLPEAFLVKVVANGNTVYLNGNQFGDSVVFDRAYQVLKLVGWKNAAEVTLVQGNMESNASEPEDFVVFPNPSSEATVYVYLKDLSEGQTLQIYDLKGNMVKTITLQGNGKEISDVEISLLPKGIYFFEVKVDGTRNVRTFVKM